MKKLILTARGAICIFAIGLSQFADACIAASGCAIAGPDNAQLTIEEYADFDCGYCARGSKTIGEILKNYPDKVKLVFRNMPLPVHAPDALTAAKAFSAVCMQSPSLAYEFQKELFKNQNQLKSEGESFLYETAEKIGVDVSQMKSDMAGDMVAKSIADDQLAAESHNFKGTPSFMIGSVPVSGALPYEKIKKIIDNQLAH